MYRNALVPLDGSELAEIILPYAEEAAARLGLNLNLLHVCVSSEPAFLCQNYVKSTAENTGHVTRSLQSKYNPGEAHTLKMNPLVSVGDPATEILSFAEKGDIDFILMSTELNSGLQRLILGSVTRKVLAAAKVPVWVVRPEVNEYLVEGKPFEILVPLDSSPAAEAVLPHVRNLARQRGTGVNITLLRVCEGPDLLSDYPEAIMPHSWAEHVRLAAENTRKACNIYLGGIQEKLASEGVNVKTEVLTGDAPRAILDYQRANPVNLMIISSHGRSGPGPWPLGSVAEKLISASASPVMVVRPG